MATEKYQFITELYRRTSDKIARNPENWQKFLFSACHNYKCRFSEQVLIYAQRPNATAVLELENWNKKFGRWVNKNSKGIAVFDTKGRSNKLKYYFDISDTHAKYPSRPVPIWHMEKQYENAVVETLSHSFSDINSTTLEDILIETAKNAVEDHVIDYVEQLKGSYSGSYLEELDDFNVEVMFKKLLSNSVAYMLLARCGVDIEAYYEAEDFADILNFNTLSTINALGTATSDITEIILREVARSIAELEHEQKNPKSQAVAKETEREYDQVKKQERTDKNDRNNLQQARGLPHTKPHITSRAISSPWQVGDHAPRVSPDAQADNLHESSDNSHPQSLSKGNRGASESTVGVANRTEERAGGSDRRAEGTEPDGLGRANEQHPTGGGRDRHKRANLQLVKPKPERPKYQQLNLFENVEVQKTFTFSISQQIIDEVLTSGGNEQNSIYRIISYFKKDHPTVNNASFLQEEYGIGGKGFIIGDARISSWFNEDGIHIAHGDTVLNSSNMVTVNWEQVAKRIRELFDMGRYAPQNELDKADSIELKAIADNLWYLHRDRKEGTEFTFLESELFKGGFPDSTARIAKLLMQPNQQEKTIKGLQDFATEYEQDSSLLRFWSAEKHLKKVLVGLLDLQREPLTFSAQEKASTTMPSFITQDEVDYLLQRGSSFQEGKFRIYFHFLQNHTQKENVDFLKNEYGTGGYGWQGFNESHDAKGIHFSRAILSEPYDKVLLKWNEVVKRIDKLISAGRYMSQKELDGIPEYEKGELARMIYHFYYNQPEEVSRPYPINNRYIDEYTEAQKVLISQLDYPERVKEITAQMRDILDTTPSSSRNYESMKKAVNAVEAYQNGTFSLFGEAKFLTKEPEQSPTLPKAFDVIVRDDKEISTGVELAISEEEVQEPQKMYQESDQNNAEVVDLNPVNEQLSSFENVEDNILTSSVSRQIIDEVLASGGNKEESILRITLHFKENDHLVDNANFLQEEYGIGGKGFIIGEARISSWSNEDGIYIAHGDTALSSPDVILINWEQTAKLIRGLLDAGRYAIQSELGNTAQKNFITQDEIDYSLIDGNDINYSKFRILSYFLQEHRLKEKADFLKNEYERSGTGSYELNKSYNSKGIEYERGNIFEPYDKVFLSWSMAARRIDKLIVDGKYMSQKELDYISEYEKGKLATIISSFYFNQPLKINRPFPVTSDIIGQPNLIRPLLDEPDSVKGILESMKEILDATDISDRHYESMEKAIEYLQEYQEGTFSLFQGIETIEKESEQEPQSSQERQDSFKFYIEWSEHPAFYDMSKRDEHGFAQSRYTDISFPLANKLLGLLDKKQYIERETYDVGWYHKTNFHISAIVNGEEINYEGRYDLGDNHGDLVNHIRLFYDYCSSPECAHWNVWKGKGEDYYEQTMEKVRFGREVFVPFLEKNKELTLEDEKLLEEIMATEPEWFTDKDKNVPIAERKEVAQKLNSLLNGIAPTVDHDNPEETVPVQSALEQSNKDLINKIITIGERNYEIESIDSNDNVHLLDITFQSSAGFPITRIEKLGYIRSYLEEQEQLKTPSEKQENLITPSLPSVSSIDQRLNYKIIDDNLGHGSAKEKYRNNVEAIKTLQRIESENRFATFEEQEILVNYTGWGGLPQAFDINRKGWENEYAELKELLTVDEYTSARGSTLNAHYTSPTVIRAIYQGLEKLGFERGNILEPSCGVGHFFGLLPDSMSDSKLFGVELDSLTGRIAKQLYQKNSIAIEGFENSEFPDSFFDVSIGNVPFGSYKLNDKRYDKHNFLIHDYFFGKALDKVRSGGVIAFVTSKGTMDKANPSVRRYIAQRAELLLAIRLPNTAFEANAGTNVTSDIIFLQKRDRVINIEPDWIHLGKTEDGIPINSYFIEHPEMVLGTMVWDKSMYGDEKGTACIPFSDGDLATQLSEAASNIQGRIAEVELEEEDLENEQSIPADPRVKNFSYTIVDGKIYYRQDSLMFPQKMSLTAENRVRKLIELRDCVRNLISYQIEDYPDSEIREEQANLNKLYDTYTSKYGLTNSRGSSMAFSEDSSYYLLCSLEIINEHGELERKADIFHKRTIKSHREITHVENANEALAVSLAEKALVDLDFMSKLTGKDEKELLEDLKNIVFLNPAFREGVTREKRYITADEYLSGNIREKLEVARESAKHNPQDFLINVEALESALPKDLTAAEISVRLGSTWVPSDVIEQFVYELLKTPIYERKWIKVHYSHYASEWNIANKSYDRGNIHAQSTYGTSRINAYKIIENTLNLRDVRVWDVVYDENNKEKRVLNKKETAIAQAKQELIRSKFADWIWKDIGRREQLCRIYNDKFNSIKPREFDGSHLTFPNMNPEIQLRKHQVDAIARGIYGENLLLAHYVGAGKTFEVIGIAMESKRIGLCNKSIIVVPNHLISQWASDVLRLYPAANILVTTKKEFDTKKRKKFCAKIATGDYDVVIIGHSQFEKIPVSMERQRNMIAGQIRDIVAGIEEIKENKGERYTIKGLEKIKKSLESRLKKLYDQGQKDDVITFEELGVDRLFVDEAHGYKNLFLVTKMRNVAGIAQTEALKSSDMYMKCRFMDEITEGRGTCFATGTPISNSMVELYTMQRYLQYEMLQQLGLHHFDAWASTFGETVTAIELAPEGTGYRLKTRFAKFHNLPELISMFRMVADIQTGDMLKLPVPEANFHIETVKPSLIQQEMVLELAKRAQAIRDRLVSPMEDNMLKITNDGRKIALDQRVINKMLPDESESKVNRCVENVSRIWHETSDKSLTQLIFCDLSTPSGKKSTIEMEEVDGVFVADTSPFENVYEDIRTKLVMKGVPREEVVFIHEANSEVQKKELFMKVRKGQVRILMGSTQKMGAGMNVQDKLIAIHDLDCPWRPSDLEQRLGRILRQGNSNQQVEIFRYVTEGTFDSYLYQIVENKQKFIAQIMTSKIPVRSAEDVDEAALSYAEIKALATGNPLIIEKCQLEMEVNQLKILQTAHLNQRYALEEMVHKSYPQKIEYYKNRIEAFKIDAETVEKNPVGKDIFPGMELKEILYQDKAEAGKALMQACEELKLIEKAINIGEYRGFAMDLEFDAKSVAYVIILSRTASYRVALGFGVHGNLTRLDNELARIPEKLETAKGNLEEILTQLRYAKDEIETPFQQEDELKIKSKRLHELNMELNLDEKDQVILDDEPKEDGKSQLKKPKERERD